MSAARAALVLLALGACGPRPAREASPPAAPPPPTSQPDIVQIGEPVLRGRAAEVPEAQIGTAELDALVARMIATMRAAPGVGLAAPQIGVPLRVIVLEDRAEYVAKLTEVELRERERAPFPTRVFVNPTLRVVGDDRATFFEGCLSVRGYAGMVTRAAEVEVTGRDARGAPQTWRVRGWPARILQHEVDHLDGVVYVDRMITRSFANADRAKELYGGRPIGEVRRLLGIEAP